MSRKLLLLFVACALACVLPGAGAARTRHKKTKPSYYLALGDSLARGAQPFGPVQANGLAQTLATSQGYANDLYAPRSTRSRA